ncbi:carboxy terminal-processing peptidase [Basilea psittacipulmonis]|uniref:carboxy terminal-processing peptidase n=1 Tax=Basilea psittacipulmonis TaxID=1472345 RepID=UPI0006915295|nr:carboxy terminal-processing peptidase [Basilea psittacipulmonis]
MKVQKLLLTLGLLTAVSTASFATEISVTEPVSNVSSSNTIPADDTFIPQLAQEEASYITAAILSKLAYDPKPLNLETSALIYKTFLKSLDPQRVFFTQKDIDDYAYMKNKMASYIARSSFDDCFDFFIHYRHRVQERYEYAISLLDKGFDFTKKESVEIDRKKSPWAKNESDIKDIWRKRVKNDYLRLKLANNSDEKIKTILKRRYNNSKNQVLRMNSEDVGELIINAYTKAVDAHSEYYSPSSAQDFAVSMSLSVEGIGAVLQKTDEYAQIRELVPGGPAAKSGMINPGDKIVAIAQGDTGPFEDVIDMRLNDIVKKVRGKRGTVIRLELMSSDQGADAKHKVVRIVREKVLMEEQAVRSKVLPVTRGKEVINIGIITIPSFYEEFRSSSDKSGATKNVSTDVKKAIESLQKENVAGLVLDLRNDGGGSLPQAAALSGLFLEPDSIVVQIQNANGHIDYVRSPRTPTFWDKPIIVLVNKFSASASEIFAGAMQDYGRALVVGDSTWGKGTVQVYQSLDNFLSARDRQKSSIGALKWTQQKFFMVSGASNQLKGIIPDIAFPSSVDTSELGESSYENAMPWTEIEPADYRPVGDVRQYLSKLTQLHKERTKESKSWNLMVDRIEYVKKVRDKKVLSLNYKVRLSEREEQEKVREGFEQRRKALGESEVDSFKLDDGLSYGEGNIKDEVADEKKMRENIDSAAREAAYILVDQIALSKKKP